MRTAHIPKWRAYGGRVAMKVAHIHIFAIIDQPFQGSHQPFLLSFSQGQNILPANMTSLALRYLQKIGILGTCLTLLNCPQFGLMKQQSSVESKRGFPCSQLSVPQRRSPSQSESESQSPLPSLHGAEVEQQLSFPLQPGSPTKGQSSTALLYASLDINCSQFFLRHNNGFP